MDRWRWLRQTDWWLVTAALALVVVGVSAIDTATEVAASAGPMQRQLVWAGIALLAMFLAAAPSQRVAFGLAYVAFGLCVPLLAAVFWSEPINGARRWLRFGPVGIQPSELAKLAFVAALARYLATRESCGKLRVVLAALVLTAIPAALILKQPDLGSAMVFVPVLIAMLFCAEVRRVHLAALLIVGLAALPALWLALSPVQRARVRGFLEQSDTGPKPHGDGYQLYQSKLMVALGGPIGSPQATDVHVPYEYADFVFSVVAGRWGLAGVTATMLLFGVLFWRGLRAAARAPDRFGRLLAVGLVVMLATQALVNMAMTVGLLPITGLTLPFVSYGGSSLLTSFIAVGVLLNIGRREGETWPSAG